ncbi:sulfatase-like hydrolase/transferase [Pontiella sp.]|uniref:sulfatase-like hydrolase/transferase n=1 Tax=Pontiella sp. TaxID=2837462 RepID=UPI003562B6A5
MKTKTLTFTLTLLCLSSAIRAAEQPNFILMMADDLGYAGLSCFGNRHGIQTPNLDAMAKNGLKFTDFHSNGTVCSPTRAALMTGRYQQRTGVTGVITAASHRNAGLAHKETTIADLLKANGYRTAIFGKWHLGYPATFNPIHQGFDEYVGFVSGNVCNQSHIDQAMQEDWWKQDQLTPEKGYQTTLIGNHTVDFIERSKDAPFFVYVAFGAPHYPIQGPNDPPTRGPDKVSQNSIDAKRAYREMIESMDAEVGRIRAKVEELGLAEKTVFFFCSDNGHSMGLGGEYSADPALRGSKATVYEGGVRVPGIAYWPGTIAPAVTEEVGMTMDLLPTFASLAAVPAKTEYPLDGIDLAPLMLHGTPLPKRPLFWSFKNTGAARLGPWKYVLTGNTGALYNLDDDRAESIDRSADFPEKFQEMQQRYADWFKDASTNPSGPQIDPNASATPVK